MIKSLNFLAVLNTLSTQVNQKMDGAPDPSSGSTLLSHWACYYYPWKVRLFLLHWVDAFVFLNLHKTLCSLSGSAVATPSQNNRDLVLLQYFALTPISGCLMYCSNYLLLVQQARSPTSTVACTHPVCVYNNTTRAWTSSRRILFFPMLVSLCF